MRGLAGGWGRLQDDSGGNHDFPVCNVVPAGCRERVDKLEELIRSWAVRGGGPSGSTSDNALNECIERSEVMPQMVALFWHCDLRP
jgi:hypothetical protein